VVGCSIIVIASELVFFANLKWRNSAHWMEQYDRVAVGMPKDDVEAMFGEVLASSPVEDQICRYSPRGCPILIEVEYDDLNQVYKKEIVDID